MRKSRFHVLSKDSYLICARGAIAVLAPQAVVSHLHNAWKVGLTIIVYSLILLQLLLLATHSHLVLLQFAKTAVETVRVPVLREDRV